MKSTKKSLLNKFYDENNLNIKYYDKLIANTNSVRDDDLWAITRKYDSLIQSLKEKQKIEKKEMNIYYTNITTSIKDKIDNFSKKKDNINYIYNIWSIYTYSVDSLLKEYLEYKPFHILETIEYKYFYLLFSYYTNSKPKNKITFTIKLIPKNSLFNTTFENNLSEYYNIDKIDITTDHALIYEKSFPRVKDINLERYKTKYQHLTKTFSNKISFLIKSDLDKKILLKLEDFFDFSLYDNSGYFINQLNKLKKNKAIFYLDDYNYSSDLIHLRHKKMFFKIILEANYDCNKLTLNIKYDYYNHNSTNEEFKELINEIENKYTEQELTKKIIDRLKTVFSTDKLLALPKEFITINIIKNDNI